MPKTDNELLREGCKSYHKALFAVMEFRRQVQDAISGVVEKRLGEVAAALKMDEDELRDGLGSHADPANFNQNYKGDFAEVGNVSSPDRIHDMGWENHEVGRSARAATGSGLLRSGGAADN